MARLLMLFLFVVSVLFYVTFLPLLAYSDTVSSKGPRVKELQLKVAFLKQETPRECGLAAAMMICNYYGEKMGKTLQDWLKSSAKGGEGILGSELIVAFKGSGFDTAVFPGTLDETNTGLYYHLEKQRPVIAMITSRDGKSSHYDVIAGYDSEKSLLFILDPALGPVTVKSQEFLPAWKRANHFTLVAMPKRLMGETPAITPSH